MNVKELKYFDPLASSSSGGESEDEFTSSIHAEQFEERLREVTQWAKSPKKQSEGVRFY